jgi:DNA-binding MarR family transcriptional regulator
MALTLQDELKQKKPFEHLEEELFLNIIRTADQISRGPASLLKSHDLSTAQYNVLRILRGAEPSGLPCGEIGSRMVTRDPDITRLLDRMEARHLVTRQRASNDRRVITARITPEGLETLTRLDRPLLEVVRKHFSFLSKPELEVLIQALERVRQHVQGMQTEEALVARS